jgi:hypothetical protein
MRLWNLRVEPSVIIFGYLPNSMSHSYAEANRTKRVCQQIVVIPGTDCDGNNVRKLAEGRSVTIRRWQLLSRTSTSLNAWKRKSGWRC